jgi:hypothetical protein
MPTRSEFTNVRTSTATAAGKRWRCSRQKRGKLGAEAKTANAASYIPAKTQFLGENFPSSNGQQIDEAVLCAVGLVWFGILGKGDGGIQCP